VVLKGTKLHKKWKKGRYIPLTTQKASQLISEFKRYVPEYVRIMRVQRDIPTFMTEAGVDKTNLRQYIEKELKKRNIRCRCIRCREIGRHYKDIKNYNIKVLEYTASWGKEFFISAEKGDSIIGFCRLRFPLKQQRKEITKFSALIRELHVYGESTSISKKGKTQHKGIGKALLKKAESIAKDNNYEKLVVISGIGARDYYRKLGYRKEGVYMVRRI
jgi:elongator complex protein 3